MRLIILGTDDFAKTMEDVAGQLEQYDSISILEATEDYKNYINENTEFFPAIYDNQQCYNLLLKIDADGGKIATIIHPSAYVSPKAVIGKGSAILPNATVNNDVVVTYGCVIDIGSIIDHHVLLGNGVHVSPGAVVRSNNLIPAFMNVDGEVKEGQYPFS